MTLKKQLKITWSISILAVLIWVGLAIWFAIDTHQPAENKVDKIFAEPSKNEFAKIFAEPSETVSPTASNSSLLPDEFWYCCAAAPASFAGVWIIYAILCWLGRVLNRLIRGFSEASNRQKRMGVLWLGIFMFVLMGLFPPVEGYKHWRGSYRTFEFFFNADSKEIAFGKLLVMWFIVAAITIGLVVTFRDKKE